MLNIASFSPEPSEKYFNYCIPMEDPYSIQVITSHSVFITYLLALSYDHSSLEVSLNDCTVPVPDPGQGNLWEITTQIINKGSNVLPAPSPYWNKTQLLAYGTIRTLP